MSLKIPDNISFDQAASLPIGLSTVLVPLFNHDPNSETANFTAFWEEGGTEKYSGKPAFIIGGASSVGQYGMSHTLRVIFHAHLITRHFSPQPFKSRSSRGTLP